MKKTFFTASPASRRNAGDSFQVNSNKSKISFSVEAIIIFSLLFLLLAFLAATFFTTKTLAASLSYPTWHERYRQASGGANISNAEFKAGANSSFNIRKTSIYRNGTDRRAGIVLPIFPTEGRFTSGFGGRSNPFGTGGEFHSGLDVAAPTGTPVAAAADGTVTFSGLKGGYGNVIIIEHDGQAVVTRYGHLSQRYVKEGETVKAGTLIGAVGSTGRSTGPHLHYEVQIDGKPTNPAIYHPQSFLR